MKTCCICSRMLVVLIEAMFNNRRKSTNCFSEFERHFIIRQVQGKARAETLLFVQCTSPLPRTMIQGEVNIEHTTNCLFLWTGKALLLISFIALAHRVLCSSSCHPHFILSSYLLYLPLYIFLILSSFLPSPFSFSG